MYFTSDNPLKRGKYLEQLTTTMTKNNLFKRISQLRSQKTASNAEFNALGNTLTQAMLSAELQLKPKNTGNFERTPLLSKAGWTVRFWKRKLSDIKAQRKNIQISKKYQTKAEIPISESNTTNKSQIMLKLKNATRALRKEQKNAKERRESFLDELAEISAIEQNKEKSAVIKKIKSTERARQIAAQVKRSPKRSNKGGLQHLEVPTNNNN